jgi:hypothetical protein
MKPHESNEIAGNGDYVASSVELVLSFSSCLRLCLRLCQTIKFQPTMNAKGQSLLQKGAAGPISSGEWPEGSEKNSNHVMSAAIANPAQTKRIKAPIWILNTTRRVFGDKSHGGMLSGRVTLLIGS